MNGLILACAGGYGALIGSFLNVCIYRLPRRCLRIWKPKLSFCPSCRRTIPWYENVPMLSFLALLGRCKGCKAPIPLRYFLVELATTVFFLWVASTLLLGDERHWGLAFVQVALFCALLVLTLVNWDTRKILNGITYPSIILALWTSALAPSAIAVSPLASLIGVILGAGALWTSDRILGTMTGHGTIGGGNVKLLAMIGAFTGPRGAAFALLVGWVVLLAVMKVRAPRNVPSAFAFAIPGGAYAFVPALQHAWLEVLGAR